MGFVVAFLSRGRTTARTAIIIVRHIAGILGRPCNLLRRRPKPLAYCTSASTLCDMSALASIPVGESITLETLQRAFSLNEQHSGKLVGWDPPPPARKMDYSGALISVVRLQWAEGHTGPDTVLVKFVDPVDALAGVSEAKTTPTLTHNAPTLPIPLTLTLPPSPRCPHQTLSQPIPCPDPRARQPAPSSPMPTRPPS